MKDGILIPMPVTFSEVFIDGKIEAFSWTKFSNNNAKEELTIGTVIFSEFVCSPKLGVIDKVNFTFKNGNNTDVVAKDVKFVRYGDPNFYTLSEIKPGVPYEYIASSVEINPPGLY